MDHKEAYNLLDLYVFGNLEDDETAAVEAHLETGCEDCFARLREVSELSAQLAVTVPQSDPSPRVEELLFDRIRSEQHGSGSHSVGKNRGFGWYTAFAAAAAAIVLLVWTSQLRQEITRLRNDLAAYEDATLLLGQPGMQFVDLAGVDPNPQAFGKVVMDPDKGTGVVYMYRLPPTPEGMEYQLWIMREGKPTSAGLFKVAKDGSAVLNLRALPDPTALARFQVTIEPEGGESKPTGMMYLTGPIPN